MENVHCCACIIGMIPPELGYSVAGSECCQIPPCIDPECSSVMRTSGATDNQHRPNSCERINVVCKRMAGLGSKSVVLRWAGLETRHSQGSQRYMRNEFEDNEDHLRRRSRTSRYLCAWTPAANRVHVEAVGKELFRNTALKRKRQRINIVFCCRTPRRYHVTWIAHVVIEMMTTVVKSFKPTLSQRGKLNIDTFKSVLRAVALHGINLA
ncbi:hypothetical protein EVAR_5559_1 [Eumeta japonica]|uniref:Uncharacterized protein n=1 Tax=Eumeta variegata TaxID=151549 RepID=A0A4C1U1G4_EUMVA|nr:hypothetical protein EVAR_5559_1 [Eumeta japonica]